MIQRLVRALTVLVGLLVFLTPGVRGQIVRGQIVDSVTQAPIAGGHVVLLGPDGSQLARTVTDPEGLFLLRASTSGVYHLRVESDGYRESEFPPFDLALDQVRGFRLLVAATHSVSNADSSEAAQIIAAVCPEGVALGLPVIVGQVTDAATGEAIGSAEVKMSWSTVPDVLANQIAFDNAEGAAVTGSTGFYGVCGAPLGVQVVMFATRGDGLSEITRVRFDDGGVYEGATFTPMDAGIWRRDFGVLERGQRTAMVTGTVVDTSGLPVANVDVRVIGTNINTRASFLGSFQLTNLPPGILRLAAERPGYRSVQRDILIQAGDSVVELPPGFLTVQSIPTQLAPITVEAPAPTTRRDLSEFFSRRESSSGSFITRAEFEKMGNVQKTTDILSRMRGIYIRTGTGALEYLITTRRGASRSGLRSNIAGDCFPIVYVDRLYVGTTANLNVNYQIPAENIEAIEVHPRAASLPPEFNRPGATCGVIVFWTR